MSGLIEVPEPGVRPPTPPLDSEIVVGLVLLVGVEEASDALVLEVTEAFFMGSPNLNKSSPSASMDRSAMSTATECRQPVHVHYAAGLPWATLSLALQKMSPTVSCWFHICNLEAYMLHA